MSRGQRLAYSCCASGCKCMSDFYLQKYSQTRVPFHALVNSSKYHSSGFYSRRLPRRCMLNSWGATIVLISHSVLQRPSDDAVRCRAITVQETLEAHFLRHTSKYDMIPRCLRLDGVVHGDLTWRARNGLLHCGVEEIRNSHFAVIILLALRSDNVSYSILIN